MKKYFIILISIIISLGWYNISFAGGDGGDSDSGESGGSSDTSSGYSAEDVYSEASHTVDSSTTADVGGGWSPPETASGSDVGYSGGYQYGNSLGTTFDPKNDSRISPYVPFTSTIDKDGKVTDKDGKPIGEATWGSANKDGTYTVQVRGVLMDVTRSPEMGEGGDYYGQGVNGQCPSGYTCSATIPAGYCNYGTCTGGYCIKECGDSSWGAMIATPSGCNANAQYSVALSWAPLTFDNGDNYYITYSVCAAKIGTACTAVSVGASTNYTLSGLPGGANYYWRVIANYSHYVGGSMWSPPTLVDSGTKQELSYFTLADCPCPSGYACGQYYTFYLQGYQTTGACSQNGQLLTCGRPWPPCAAGTVCGGYDGWGSFRIPTGYCTPTGQKCSTCASYNYEGAGECVSYAVVDCYSQCPYPPNPPILSVNTPPNFCSSEVQQYLFQWTFSDPNTGDTQSAKQLQIATNPSFNSNVLVYNETIPNASPSAVSPVLPTGNFTFGQTYYWRVKVWDSTGRASNWAVGTPFTTPTHYYPIPDFTFSPDKTIIGETVQFTDASSGTGTLTYLWSFQDATPATSTSQNPSVEFNSRGTKTVTLTVTDSSGYACDKSETIPVSTARYEWREIAPW
jgi:hypothetical protein